MKIHLNPPMRRAQSSGFTLIELLVVMAIIALLAALSFGGFQHAMQATFRNRTVATLSAITSTLEQYKEKFGEYPEPPDADKTLTGGPDSMRIGGAMMLYQAITGDGSDHIKLAAGTATTVSNGIIEEVERANVFNGDFVPIKDNYNVWKSKLNATFVSGTNQFMLIDGFGHPFFYEKAAYDTNGKLTTVNVTYDLWSIAHSKNYTNIYLLTEKQDGTNTATWFKNW